MINTPVEEIIKQTREANSEEFALLERTLAGDTRKSVIRALSVARKRLDAEQLESDRLNQMYLYEESVANSKFPDLVEAPVIVGLDEVGRGPMAGPLAVGAVILPRDSRIAGLNDSKKIPHNQRENLSHVIQQNALAWHVEYIEPNVLDDIGITESLKRAFRAALSAIEKSGYLPDVVLLDGNPLNFDSREVNIIKGDGKCASIAAASIIAKVSRDALMDDYALKYPQYGFETNKGYGTQAHRDAIGKYGLSPIHRKSFCMEFLQSSLF